MEGSRAEDCRKALRTIYFFAAGWGSLKEAIWHLMRCRQDDWCIDVWLGWELSVQRAARLRKTCGDDRPFIGAGMAARCAETWAAFRMPVEGAALRVATQHLLDCTRRDCVLLQLALVDYFRGFHLINNPSDHLAIPFEDAAEP